MHITFDGRMLTHSGIGTYIKTLLPFFAKENRFTFTILHHEKDKKALLKFPFRLIAFKSPIYSAQEQLEFCRKIPSCSLFWSPHINVPLLPIKAKKKMVTLHDVFHLAHFKKLSLLQKIYAQILYNVAAFSDQMICVSQFSQKEMKKYLTKQPKHVAVIHNGLVLERFSPSLSHEARKLKEKYSLPLKFILAIGNAKPHKNLPRLIQAFKEISCEEHLVIIGKKEGFNGYFKEKNVHFLGEVNDEEIPLFFHLATMHVFPSLYEGFGFPPLEAMAAGCPVVASNKGSLPEICGDSVEYIDPNNLSSIKAGMWKILYDVKRREELILQGFSHVKRYNAQNMYEQHIKLIESIVV